MNLRNRRTLFVPVLVAALLAMASCGGANTGELVSSAKAYLQKNDTKAAAIQLRNARQNEPNNAEVRYLLGVAFLNGGDPSAAESELRKALELKYPADAVLPLIAQSLQAQREYKKLAAEFANPKISDPKARAQIQTTVAIAAFEQGDMKQAREMLKAALEANPDLTRAHVLRAKLALSGGDPNAASEALDAALKSAPNDVEAGVMKSQLLAGQSKSAESIALLEKLVAANPSALHPKYALFSRLLYAGQNDKSAVVLEGMKKEAPTHFLTVLADGQLALANGDGAKARDRAQVLLAGGEPSPDALLLSAQANLRLKNYSVAEEAAQQLVGRQPNNPAPRRLLAWIYLNSGRPSQALDTAEAALRRTPDDAGLLRLAGEARIRTGDVGEATRLYERAAALDRDTPAVQLRLAQIRMMSGDTTRGLSDLEKLSGQDATSIEADLSLYQAHLRKREYDKALAAVAAIEKKRPKDAIAAELRGQVYLARYDLKQARKHFEAALALEPNRHASARSLAIVDLHEGKPADARARFDKLIAAQPKNELPIIAKAEIMAISGAPPEEVRSTLERAIAANPTSMAPRVSMVAHYRRVGDGKGALEAARAAAAALPNEPRALEMYGSLQLASGDAAQARETFMRLTQVLPQSAGPWLRVAETFIATKDYAGALEAQRKALSIDPDNTTAVVALAGTYLVSGKPDDAIAEARRIQRDRPKSATGYALEAELLAYQKKFPEAVTLLREAIARQPTAAFGSRNYALLLAAGRTGEANAFADRWIKEHPKDAAFLSLIGQQRQAAKDAAGAAAVYRAALELEPENVVVLNNLAWMLSEQGKPEARDLAERAYRLAPLNASVVDTLGTVLTKQGDAARGVALLRQATNLAPQDPRMRLNLARALAKSGDKAGARREVEQAVARGLRDPVKSEAEQLLREL